jgi:hypothetical protein
MADIRRRKSSGTDDQGEGVGGEGESDLGSCTDSESDTDSHGNNNIESHSDTSCSSNSESDSDSSSCGGRGVSPKDLHGLFKGSVAKQSDPDSHSHPRKRKKPSSNDASAAPPRSLRVRGSFYIHKGVIRIWNGHCFLCVHKKPPKWCKEGCVGNRRNLISRDFPHLVAQWSPNNPSIDHYTTGSDAKVEWICGVNREHVWSASIYNRTGKIPTGCPKCRLIHDPVAKRQKQDDPRDGKSNPTRVGDATEHWSADQIRPHIESALVIGNTSDKTDLVAKLSMGTCHSIQCKTMYPVKGQDDVYNVSHLAGYQDKILFMMVNKARTRFAVMFTENIGGACIRLAYGAGHETKYAPFMFTNLDTFIARVVAQLPLAAEYVSNISSSTQKEADMYRRLEVWLQARGSIWLRNPHNDDATDGWIDGVPVQCKFRSNLNGITYRISMQKKAGTMNGRGIKKAYAITDPFDIVVVELGGSPEQPDKYHGQFAFLPKAKLVEHGILSTTVTERGKFSMRIAPPDFARSHWTLAYWNRLPTIQANVGDGVQCSVAEQPMA